MMMGRVPPAPLAGNGSWDLACPPSRKQTRPAAEGARFVVHGGEKREQGDAPEEAELAFPEENARPREEKC